MVVEGLVVETESPLLIMAETDSKLCVEYCNGIYLHHSFRFSLGWRRRFNEMELHDSKGFSGRMKATIFGFDTSQWYVLRRMIVDGHSIPDGESSACI